MSYIMDEGSNEILDAHTSALYSCTSYQITIDPYYNSILKN